MSKRATYNGEIGANGEEYKAGQFIAQTEQRKGSKKAVKATGKREVAPYVWEVAPTATARPILAGLTTAMPIREAGKVVAFEFYKPGTFCGYDVTELIALWNSGQRWIEPK